MKAGEINKINDPLPILGAFLIPETTKFALSRPGSKIGGEAPKLFNDVFNGLENPTATLSFVRTSRTD